MVLSPTPRRQRQRQATEAEIKTVARRQMAAEGAAALSLRAVAREMGLTAPALYRYYPGRDDLVTALIVDAYDALGAAVAAAADRAAAAGAAPHARLVAAALAYRAWALAHPADYALVFGTPIPGYHAPFHLTQPAAVRSGAPFVAILAAAHGGGPVPPALAATPPDLLRAVLTAWSQLHGFVSLELNGQFAALGADPADVFRHLIADLADRLLGPAANPDPPPA